MLAGTIVATVIHLLGLVSGTTKHAAALAAVQADESRPEMVRVTGGIYTPVFPPTPEETRIPVATFMLDVRPVTHEEFRAFVVQHPQWRRDRVARITADTGYLSHWVGATELGPAAPPRAPATHVSWFAAKAYCEARGARLPMEAEWEFVASASETQADARKDPAWVARILDWYGRPSGAVLRDVGTGSANYFRVHDMHGLVWEWVLDFNSAMVENDARGGGNGDKQKFCGGGALGAAEKSDYATFMRFAMRSSLVATYTGSSLGFRCARDERTKS